ncbi:MAG: DUF2235 domain-containing protein [Gemmobacter sp.]
MIRLRDLLGWFRHRRVETTHSEPVPERGRVDHVVILDGTMSSLEPGAETNAGITWKLLDEARSQARVSLYYEPGLQWLGWRNVPDVMQGRGLDEQIQRAYGFIATRYRPGDRIYLFGYSRGAYAVRSLAGMIDRLGLLRRDQATERNIAQVFRHYQRAPDSAPARAFVAAHCHPGVTIQMIGVWDTVKALGVRLPVLWRFSEVNHVFHNHRLGPAILHGFQALALHETRVVFEPVLWDCPPGWEGSVEQVWFRGAHGDIGGQLGGFEAARPLANIPLVWMLEKAEDKGLPLPGGWRDRFPRDPGAPMTGAWRSWGKIFLLRRPRVVGRDRSERLHPTAIESVPAARTVPDIPVSGT